MATPEFDIRQDFRLACQKRMDLLFDSRIEFKKSAG
jgi:hypothetical protein